MCLKLALAQDDGREEEPGVEMPERVVGVWESGVCDSVETVREASWEWFQDRLSRMRWACSGKRRGLLTSPSYSVPFDV